MKASIHDVVTTDRVAVAVEASAEQVGEVLAAQRRAISFIQAANHVVLLPSVTLRHRDDPLGDWCDANYEHLFDSANAGRAKVALARDASRLDGTALAIEAGCPPQLLTADSDRGVWALSDVALLVCRLCETKDEGDSALVNRILDSFWEIANRESELAGWFWTDDRVAMERAIEDWLVQNLDVLEPFGLNVVLAEPRQGVSGRQWRSGDGTSRLDLLLEVVEDGRTVAGAGPDERDLLFRTGDLVVVELKAVRLRGDDVEQVVRYVNAVEAEIADGRHVWGMLVGAGADQTFYDTRDAMGGEILSLWLSQIGFIEALIPQEQ